VACCLIDGRAALNQFGRPRGQILRHLDRDLVRILARPWISEHNERLGDQPAQLGTYGRLIAIGSHRYTVVPGLETISEMVRLNFLVCFLLMLFLRRFASLGGARCSVFGSDHLRFALIQDTELLLNC